MTVSVRCTRLTETKSRLRLVKLAKLHEGINVTHYKQLTAARRLFEFMSCSKVYKQTSTRVTKNAASCLSEFMSCSELNKQVTSKKRISINRYPLSLRINVTQSQQLLTKNNCNTTAHCYGMTNKQDARNAGCKAALKKLDRNP